MSQWMARRGGGGGEGGGLKIRSQSQILLSCSVQSLSVPYSTSVPTHNADTPWPPPPEATPGLFMASSCLFHIRSFRSNRDIRAIITDVLVVFSFQQFAVISQLLLSALTGPVEDLVVHHPAVAATISSSASPAEDLPCMVLDTISLAQAALFQCTITVARASISNSSASHPILPQAFLRRRHETDSTSGGARAENECMLPSGSGSGGGGGGGGGGSSSSAMAASSAAVDASAAAAVPDDALVLSATAGGECRCRFAPFRRTKPCSFFIASLPPPKISHFAHPPSPPPVSHAVDGVLSILRILCHTEQVQLDRVRALSVKSWAAVEAIATISLNLAQRRLCATGALETALTALRSARTVQSTSRAAAQKEEERCRRASTVRLAPKHPPPASSRAAPPAKAPSNPNACPVCGVDDDKNVLGCDTDDCPSWCHLACVNLTKAPAKKEKWFCYACRLPLNSH